MKATFVPHSPDPFRSIFSGSVVGNIITPNLPGTLKRVVILVNDYDYERYLNYSEYDYNLLLDITDQLTGECYDLQRADCGAGCRCGIEFAL